MPKFGANVGHPYIKPKPKTNTEEILNVIDVEPVVETPVIPTVEVVELVEPIVVEQVVEPASDVFFAIDEEPKEKPNWKSKRDRRRQQEDVKEDSKQE